MNRPRQARWWLAFCAAGLMLVFPAPAQDSTNLPAPAKSFSAPTNIMPPLPQSPVNIFRQLLAMTPRERENYLTNRPPEIRERILAKVREYLALGPDERELRLNATELRWYLLPLLRESPTNRDARLAQVPDNLRDLVRSRLEQWDALPPQFQQEFLDNERTLHYFSHMDPTNAAAGTRRAARAERCRTGALEGVVGRASARKSPRSSTSFLNSRRTKNRKRSTRCPTPSARRWKKRCSHSTNCRPRSAPNAFAPSRNLRA